MKEKNLFAGALPKADLDHSRFSLQTCLAVLFLVIVIVMVSFSAVSLLVKSNSKSFFS
jgi:hypothetical protein